MAVVENVEEDPTSLQSSQTVIGDNGLRHRIPLTHPSEVRKTKTTIKPLVDLGLPQQAQDDVMDAINASFASNDPNYSHPQVGDSEEEEEEEEEYEAGGSEGEGVERVVHDIVDKDPNEEFWDEFFDSLVITVPFTFLYLLLDILVHLQYQHRPTIAELASHLVRAVPTLGVLVFYTNRHANHPATIWFLTSASILSGSRLIWLVNKAGWSLTTNQAPPMGTLWILTIVQLPLSRAVLALAGVAAYTYHSGLKLMP